MYQVWNEGSWLPTLLSWSLPIRLGRVSDVHEQTADNRREGFSKYQTVRLLNNRNRTSYLHTPIIKTGSTETDDSIAARRCDKIMNTWAYMHAFVFKKTYNGTFRILNIIHRCKWKFRRQRSTVTMYAVQEPSLIYCLREGSSIVGQLFISLYFFANVVNMLRCMSTEYLICPEPNVLCCKLWQQLVPDPAALPGNISMPLHGSDWRGVAYTELVCPRWNRVINPCYLTAVHDHRWVAHRHHNGPVLLYYIILYVKNLRANVAAGFDYRHGLV
jgi:hypothetical protein